MRGNIFNIQKFSIHDGPGLRTTVFFKGCPLRCKWCSNPESQLENIEISYDSRKCVQCLCCVNICPNNAINLAEGKIVTDKQKCQSCMACVDHCVNRALTLEGKLRTVDEVLKECLQDVDFYIESGGGVTLSGGECLLQKDFVKELVLKLKDNNINVAVETTGYIKQEDFRELAPKFDLLLFDIKHYDTKIHQKYTKVDNKLILENLNWAKENGLNILPRIPVIPGFNNSIKDAEKMSDLLVSMDFKQVQLLPFHQFGERKYELLNRDYEYKNVKAINKEELASYQQIFLDKGIDCFF